MRSWRVAKGSRLRASADGLRVWTSPAAATYRFQQEPHESRESFMVESDASDAMIQADGLCKYYGTFIAIEDISFRVPRGEVVAFLGPNGAGKSTTMKILTGYLAPSAGTARIAGFDMATERIAGAERLGYLPENGPLYPDMTPRSLLEFFADARGLSGSQRDERIEAVIGQCELGSVIGKAIGKLSKGYRQRVGMAQVLLHEPDVLILDEPTSGLDPNQIREVRETIRRLGESKTILLSTHILQEVEALADRVLLVAEGRLVFDGRPSDLAGPDGSLADRFHELTRGSAA
jgi:ABC-2 type transport system ATP-binding protein